MSSDSVDVAIRIRREVFARFQTMSEETEVPIEDILNQALSIFAGVDEASRTESIKGGFGE